MAKRFMFVCLGVLALALAYHLGASSAVSDPIPGEVPIAIAGTASDLWVLTDAWNIYQGQWTGPGQMTWTYCGDWIQPATATQPTTWGQIKSQYGK